MIENKSQLNIEWNSLPQEIIDNKKELKKHIGTRAAQILQEIVQDNEYRRDNCKTNIKLLAAGVWMPYDYYTCLKKTNQTKRLDWLVKHNYFYQFYAPKHFKNPINIVSSTGFQPNQLILKEGVLPSVALDFKKNLFIVDCTVTIDITYYKILLLVLGEEKFNKLFSHQQGKPLFLGVGLGLDNPLNFFLLLFKNKKEDRRFKIGEVVYFKNVPFCIKKHILANGAVGFNTLCINDQAKEQLFTGLDLPSKGAKEKEIKRILIDCYNLVPKNLDLFTDELVDKIYKGGKTVYQLRSNYFDLSLKTEERESYIKYLEANPENSSQLKAFKAIPITLTEEEANKDSEFGYKRENSAKLNIKIIQNLIKLPLEIVSILFVECFFRKQISK